MPTRAQVQILSLYDNTSIFLYQHYDGDKLYNTVKKSIARSRPIWNDEEYLARVIFSDMIKDNLTDLYSFGISTSKHGDIEFMIEVDAFKREIIEYHILNDEDCEVIRSELFNDIWESNIWEQSLLSNVKPNVKSDKKQTTGVA